MTRENWGAMIDNDLLPDFVINLDDDEAPENFLLSRFLQIHNLSLPASERLNESHEVIQWLLYDDSDNQVLL